MKKTTIKNLIIFLTTLAVLIAVAVQQRHSAMQTDDIRTIQGDTIVINTAQSGAEIRGYAGTVPVEIFIADGKIAKIHALPNAESTDFFNRAATLLSSWDGLTPEQALSTRVDAVTGATYSSRAIISNVQAGLQAYQREMQHESIDIEPYKPASTPLSASNICALIVLLSAMILPLFWKNKYYRTAQLALNVLIIGLWSCTFINFSLLLSAVDYGLDPLTSYLPLLMLIAAFAYPLFGKKQYYCTNICPLGSAQELTARIPAPKLRIGPKTAKWLTTMREVLWAVLMIVLAFGIWADWIGYEPFVAFALQSASVGIIIFAVIILIISIFVPRAYCRFACPTGTLLKSVPQFKK